VEANGQQLLFDTGPLPGQPWGTAATRPQERKGGEGTPASPWSICPVREFFSKI
jgi:hypothetical protein